TALDERYTGGWIIFWGVLASVMGCRVRSLRYFLFLLVSGVVILGIIAYGAFLFGRWIPLVPSALAWLLSAVAVFVSVAYQPVSEVSHNSTRWIWNPVERERLARFILPRAEIIEETYRTVCQTLRYTAVDIHSDAEIMEWAEELYVTLATRKILYDREPLT